MSESEITALAREYAEWVTDVSKAEELPNCLLNEANKLIADGAERMLTWLSTRYCLVEKEAVRKWTGVKLRLPEIDQRVLICERVANRYKIFIGRRIALSNGGWEWNQSTKESVVAWMPLPKYPQDLAKEVES